MSGLTLVPVVVVPVMVEPVVVEPVVVEPVVVVVVPVVVVVVCIGPVVVTMVEPVYSTVPVPSSPVATFVTPVPVHPVDAGGKSVVDPVLNPVDPLNELDPLKDPPLVVV
jgi:hypothetical protein